MYKKMIKRSLILLIGFAFIFGVPTSPILADRNGHGVATGVGDIHDFKTGAYKFTGKSFQPNKKIHRCKSVPNPAEDCKKKENIEEVTVKKFLEDGGYYTNMGEKKVQSIFNSSDVWVKTMYWPSVKHGKPIFYSRDASPKDPTYWHTPGDKKGNKLATDIFNHYNNKYNGKLRSGAWPTTVIFSNMVDPKEDEPPEDVAPPKPPEKKPPKRPPTEKETPNIKIIHCREDSGPQYVLAEEGKEVGYEKIDGVQAVYAVMQPVKPIGFDSMSDDKKQNWLDTHQPQKTKPIITPYGQYLIDKTLDGTIDKLRDYWNSGEKGDKSNYRKLWEEFAQGAKDAIAQGVPKITIDFSESNKEGFGRGGVFTYVEMRKNVTIESTHLQDFYDKYYCEYFTYSCNCKKDGGCSTCSSTQYAFESGGHILDGEYAKDEVKQNTVIINGSDYYPHVSYQYLNVRCNKDEFKNLFNSLLPLGARDLTQGNGNGASTMRSPINTRTSPYHPYRIADYFNHLTTNFFYNGNSCNSIFSCTSQPLPTANHDIANNKLDTGNVLHGKFGSQSKNTRDKTSDIYNSSEFSFFRDNVPKEIRNDIWYLSPSNSNTSEHTFNPKVNQASATLIAMDKQGTPRGELFELLDEGNQPIIKGADLDSSNAYINLYGQFNKFKWKASWASEKSYPHRMNIKYAYKPRLVNNNLKSFNRDDTETKIEKTEYVLDMFCDTKFNTLTPNIPEIKNQPMEDAYLENLPFSNIREKLMIVDFVKSSAE